MAVEDHARVGAARVLGEEVDDRVPADLLLAVAGDPDVHRQLALAGEQLHGLDERVQLALVVGDPPPVVPAVPLGQLERAGFPEVERRRRLDVVVSVDEDGGRGAVAAARRNLPEDELALTERGHLRLAPRALDEVREPLGRADDVLPVRGVGAHGGDRDELPQLVEPGLLHGG